MTKSAIVTGGTRGVGARVVELLSDRQWDARGWGHSNFDFYDAPYLYGSMVKPEEDAELQSLSALVLCAGEWYSCPLEIQSVDDYFSQLNFLIGHWWMIKAYLPYLERNNGVVIGVASTRAFIGGVETGPYSVAKAALVAMMQGYAREYGHGIRFNTVCSGLVNTDMGQEVIATGGAKPGAAMLEPLDVAQVIVNLIESDANGKVIRIVANKDNPPDIAEANWTFTEWK